MVGLCRVCKTNQVLSIDGYCLVCAVVFTGNWYALMPARRPTKHAPDVAKAAAKKGVLHKNRNGKRAGVA